MSTRYTRTDSRDGSPPSRNDPQPNVPLHCDEIPWESWSEGKRFAGREKYLSRLAGAQQLHVNMMVVPAGKQSCPFHYHLREEEHFYVLEGSCTMRSGEQRHELRAGDYVCFPAATGVAHAFENRGEQDCVMLAIGPSDPAEIAVYPDSGKAKLRATQSIVRWPQESLDYWDGEKPEQPLG